MIKTLDNIEKSVLEMYMHNPDLAKEELSEAGYDVDSLVSDGLNLIKQLQFKQQVSVNKNKMLSLYSKAKELLSKRIQVNREEALSILATYQVKVQYRNIVSFSEDELNNILNDVDIVKLIDELERKG